MIKRTVTWSIGAALFSVVIFLISYLLISNISYLSPKYSFNVAMSLSAPGGSFETYVNQDYKNPRRVEATRQGRATYEFRDIPAQLTGFRIDPVDLGGIEFVIHELFIAYDEEIIYRFPSDFFSGMQRYNVQETAETGKFRTTNANPMIYASVPKNAQEILSSYKKKLVLRKSFLVFALLITASAVLLIYQTVFRQYHMRQYSGGLFETYRRLSIRRFLESFLRFWAIFLFGFASLSKMRRVIVVSAVMGWMISSIIFPIVVERSISVYIPEFEMVVDAKVSDPFGNTALYINYNWHNPRRSAMPVVTGRYIFNAVPKDLTYFRLDLPMELGAKAQIINIYFRTAKSYVPYPQQTIYTFTDTEISGWQLEAGQWIEPGRVFHADRRMPSLHAPRKFDLETLLPTSPSIPANLLVLRIISVTSFVLAIFVCGATFAAILRQIGGSFKLACLIFTGTACWIILFLSAFPGHWNWDQFYSFNELVAENLSDLHPPLYVISWFFLIRVGEIIGLGYLGQIAFVFIVQITLFWVAATYIASHFRNLFLASGMLIAIVAIPATLSLLGDIGKDGHLMIALFLATFLIYLADKNNSFVPIILSVPVLFYGFAVRSNAPAAVFPLCVYFSYVLGGLLKERGIWHVLVLGRYRFGIFIGAATTAIFSAFFFLSIGVYKLVIDNPCCLGAAGAASALHDLMGLTARTEINLLPDYVVPNSSEVVGKVADNYWNAPGSVEFAGLQSILPAEQQSDFIRVWIDSIIRYPSEYIQHRLWVNKYFFGFTAERNMLPYFTGTATPEYPWVTPYARTLMSGLGHIPLWLTKIKAGINSYLWFLSDSGFMRLWVYLLAMASAFIFLPHYVDTALSRLSVALGVSSMAHIAPLVFLTASASTRYLSWPFLAIVVLIFIRFDESLSIDRLNAVGKASRSNISRVFRQAQMFPIGRSVSPAANCILWASILVGLGYWISWQVPVG